MTPTVAGAEPVVPSAPTETFADIAERLGGIPVERIIWLPRPATEDDAVRLTETHRPVELIDGFLVEKAMGFRESLLAAVLIHKLLAFVTPRKLGLVGAPDAIVRLRKGQLRLPDVSFISWDQLLATDAHTKRVAPLAPNLAVEVLSEGNTQAEMTQKRRELFAAGTLLVWVIDPQARTAEVFADPSKPNQMALVRETDALDGGTVLPGFRLPLSELFGDLDPPAPPAPAS